MPLPSLDQDFTTLRLRGASFVIGSLRIRGRSDSCHGVLDHERRLYVAPSLTRARSVLSPAFLSPTKQFFTTPPTALVAIAPQKKPRMKTSHAKSKQKIQCIFRFVIYLPPKLSRFASFLFVCKNSKKKTSPTTLQEHGGNFFGDFADAVLSAEKGKNELACGPRIYTSRKDLYATPSLYFATSRGSISSDPPAFHPEAQECRADQTGANVTMRKRDQHQRLRPNDDVWPAFSSTWTGESHRRDIARCQFKARPPPVVISSEGVARGVLW